MSTKVKHITSHDLRDLIQNQNLDEMEILDVRQDWEYEQGHLPGARLIPITELVDSFDSLDRKKPVVVYCRTGSRSMAAAEYLSANGLSDVTNLSGGFVSWSGGVAKGDTQAGTAWFAEAVAVQEVYCLAAGMELALKDFYQLMESRYEREDLKQAFRQLAGFEDKHMEVIYSVYRKAYDNPVSMTDFLDQCKAEAVEGGLPVEDFFSPGVLGGLQDVFDLAMTFEVQALDLYSRLGAASDDDDLKRLYARLAREEQYHLKILGNLSDRFSKN